MRNTNHDCLIQRLWTGQSLRTAVASAVESMRERRARQSSGSKRAKRSHGSKGGGLEESAVAARRPTNPPAARSQIPPAGQKTFSSKIYTPPPCPFPSDQSIYTDRCGSSRLRIRGSSRLCCGSCCRCSIVYRRGTVWCFGGTVARAGAGGKSTAGRRVARCVSSSSAIQVSHSSPDLLPKTLALLILPRMWRARAVVRSESMAFSTASS
jgi:hypothetical protein